MGAAAHRLSPGACGDCDVALAGTGSAATRQAVRYPVLEGVREFKLRYLIKAAMAATVAISRFNQMPVLQRSRSPWLAAEVITRYSHCNETRFSFGSVYFSGNAGLMDVPEEI